MAGMAPQTVDTKVATASVAATILKALGLDPMSLGAVKAEQTPELPGVEFAK